MTDSLLHFMMNYFFILCTRETKNNMLLFWTGFFGHCLFPFAGPSISMLLFVRVTTPELAKSTENQGDTSPVQMCCYNRISLMGVFKKREKGKGRKNLWGGREPSGLLWYIFNQPAIKDGISLYHLELMQ